MTDQFDSLPTDPTLTCSICGDPCKRSQVESGSPWVHVDDRISIGNLQTKYNHEAVIDIIDVEVIYET